MDYTKLIHDFMDGTLDGTEEEQMFFQFSSNDELRAELKQQIAIREAIRNDTRAFTPAASSTVGVFSTLGFSPPSTVFESVMPPNKGGKTGFFTKYRQGLISAAFSIAATAAVFLLLMNPFGNGNVTQSNNVNPSVAQTQTIPGNIPNVQSFSNDESKTKIRYITKVRYVDVPRYVDRSPAQNNTENTGTLTSNNETANTDLTSADLDSHINPVSALADNQKEFPENLSYGVKSNYFNNLIMPNEQLGLSFEFRGSQYWNFDNVYINPFKYQEFNNTAIALYYNISDNFAVGAEYRRENFYQKFESNEKDTLFQQQPNFNSLGLNLRYTLPFEYGGIYPFLQSSIGGNNAGVIYRGMVGLIYSPYRDITFIIGGEYSGLSYYHKNNWFNTGKFGLNYGVMVNF
ncbi:MAG: hypothetical protein EPN82_11320 [Bacteroidetes bacterium]|nr:MAG: hypothetical protein EPN82_11320 [Bacteroidota bacterium]